MNHLWKRLMQISATMIVALAMVFAFFSPVKTTLAEDGEPAETTDTTITSLAFKQNEYTIHDENYFKLYLPDELVISPEGAKPELTWETSDQEVATIDEYGILHVMNYGNDVTVTVSTKDGKLKASTTIHCIHAPAPKSISSPNGDDFTVYKGYQTFIPLSYEPADSSTKVKYEKDDPQNTIEVKYDAYNEPNRPTGGLYVSGLTAGDSKVTVISSDDSSVTKTFNIHVLDKTPTAEEVGLNYVIFSTETEPIGLFEHQTFDQDMEKLFEDKSKLNLTSYQIPKTDSDGKPVYTYIYYRFKYVSADFKIFSEQNQENLPFYANEFTGGWNKNLNCFDGLITVDLVNEVNSSNANGSLTMINGTKVSYTIGNTDNNQNQVTPAPGKRADAQNQNTSGKGSTAPEQTAASAPVQKAAATSSTANQTKAQTSPNTGDHNNIPLYCLLAVVSIVLAGSVVVIRKKNG